MGLRVLEPRTRSRRRAAIVGGAVLALGGIAAGCGGDESSTGASAGKVAQFVPAGAPIYGEVSTDLDGAQWTQAKALGAKFPAWPEFTKKLLSDPQAAAAYAIARPLLGERAAFALTKLPKQDGGALSDLTSGQVPDAADIAAEGEFIAAIEAAEGKGEQMKSLLLASGDVKRLGARDGVEVFGDDEMKAAVVDDVLVVSNTDAGLNAALAAKKAGGSRTIAGTPRVTDALAKLPKDVFAHAFMDFGAVIAASGQDDPRTAAALKALNISPEASVVMAATAETTGVRVKAIATGVPVQPGVANFTPKLTANVPSDAVAYFGTANLAAQLRSSIDIALRSNPDAQRQIDALLPQLPALLGVTLGDLTELATKEHAFIVTKSPKGAGVAAVLEQGDGAKASKTLDSLRTRLPQLAALAGQGQAVGAFTAADLGGLKGWTMKLDVPGELPIAVQPSYGVDGKLVYVGLTPESITSVRSPVSTLANNPDYVAATKQVPSAVGSLVWVSVPEGLKAIESIAKAAGEPNPFADEEGKKARANLAPVASVVAWSTTGEESTTEAFVTIK